MPNMAPAALDVQPRPPGAPHGDRSDAGLFFWAGCRLVQRQPRGMCRVGEKKAGDEDSDVRSSEFAGLLWADTNAGPLLSTGPRPGLSRLVPTCGRNDVLSRYGVPLPTCLHLHPGAIQTWTLSTVCIKAFEPASFASTRARLRAGPFTSGPRAAAETEPEE